MPINPLLPIIAAGGAVLVIEKGKTASAPVSSAPVQTRRGAIKGTLSKSLVLQGLGTTPGAAGIKATDIVGTWSPTSQASHDQLVKAAEDRLKAEYDKLDAAARKRGAELVNQQLGTHLTGDESFGEAAAIIGAASAAGACAATGIGTTVAGLCGIAGAYLGKKIGDYIEGAWDDVKDWASDAWSDTKDAVGGAVGDALDSIGSWFS